ncbi:MAG: hypothetical protein ACLURV_12095 [Gallintestinimicrobium sp.]
MTKWGFSVMLEDESIKGAEFALGKKKSWLKYILVFGLIFFCWYERNFLAQAAEKSANCWTIFIIIVLSLTYLV